MKPTARDYKKIRRGGFDLGRYREFGYGLATGLVIALLVFVVMNERARQAPNAPTEPRPDPRPTVANAAEPEDAGRQFDFYEMLPKFEVVVPEKDRDVKRDAPASSIERPGVYVLQAGSFKNLADADRVRAQLELQGVQAAVQRVAVDTDVWHRVRIGPIADLVELNRVRDKLRSAEIDALVIRVGD